MVPSVTPAQQTRLVTRCREGDESAWARVYQLWSPVVSAYLRRQNGPQADLEDLLQQVFVELFAGIDRFRGDSELSTWLYRIAARVSAKAWRKQKRHRRRISALTESLTARPTESLRPDDALAARQTLALVDAVVASLKPIHRDVWLLSAAEGLTLSEIAEVLEVRVGTVRSRLTKARRLVAAGLARRGLGVARGQPIDLSRAAVALAITGKES
ncbi:MAG: RNA polymerase sigma-70 factor (ECF subfamily) [Myxococcota bacterium]|jgi:RNA polymerase sigma-70 factor (ECF subfamily)